MIGLMEPAEDRAEDGVFLLIRADAFAARLNSGISHFGES